MRDTPCEKLTSCENNTLLHFVSPIVSATLFCKEKSKVEK